MPCALWSTWPSTRRQAVSRLKRLRRVRVFRRSTSRIFWLRSCAQHALGHARQGRRLCAHAPARAVHGGRDLAPDRGQSGAGRLLDGDCKGCSRSDECPTLDVWKNLDKLINDYLDGVTLDALVAPNEGYDYVI